MNEDQGQAMPAVLMPQFDAAQRAYAAWLEVLGDFFRVDEVPAAEAHVHDEVRRLFGAAVAAGVPDHDLIAALQRRFPEAVGRDFFESATSPDGDLPDPIGGLPDPGAYSAPSDSVAPRFAPPAVSIIDRGCPACGSRLPIEAQFCPKCGNETPELKASDLLPVIDSLITQVRGLQSAANAQLPTTNLLAPNFMTRAFAVYGHALAAGLLVSIPLYALFFVLTLLLGLAGR